MAHPPNTVRLNMEIDGTDKTGLKGAVTWRIPPILPVWNFGFGGKSDSIERSCHAALPLNTAPLNMEIYGANKTMLKDVATWRILPILPVWNLRLVENRTVLKGAVTRRILSILPV